MKVIDFDHIFVVYVSYQLILIVSLLFRHKRNLQPLRSSCHHMKNLPKDLNDLFFLLRNKIRVWQIAKRVVMAFNIYCYTWSVTYFNCLLPCCSTQLLLHCVIVIVVVLASLVPVCARAINLAMSFQRI